MATVTVRPDATISLGGATVTGAGGDADVALSDSSDSSYVDLGVGDVPQLGFAEPSIPAGALVKELTARIRLALAGGQVRFTLTDGNGGEGEQTVAVTWNSPTTITLATGKIVTADTPNAVQMALAGLAAGGFGVVRVYELYVDVVYVPKPVCNVLTPTGTLTEDNQPTVSWDATLDPDGGPQAAFQVRVMADGENPDVDTPVADSGVVESAATSWRLEEPLANGTYDVYVKVAQ